MTGLAGHQADKLIIIVELIEKKLWWSYLEKDLQELIRESLLLSSIFEKHSYRFSDYSFIVFPAAKAYEGFLKKLFFDMGFITSEEFYGKRFRIGKALNPSLDRQFRKESIYDKLVNYCSGEDLANKLWDTWKLGRNLIFHWLPDEKNAIAFPEAKERILLVLDAMEEAFKSCKIEKSKKE